MKLKTIFFSSCIFMILFLTMILPACKKKSEEAQARSKEAEQAAEKDIRKARVRRETKGLIIKTNPQDGQTIRNLEQAIQVYFSKEVKPDDFSFTVDPDPGEWEASWKEGRFVSLQHQAPFMPAVQYELEIVIKSKKISRIIHFKVYGPSSLYMIGEDEEKGLLDLDTAWIYRLQALFTPEELPLKYQSHTPLYCGTVVMRDFQLIRAKLKPSTIEKLKPYIVRPTHAESVFARRIVEKTGAAPQANFSLIPGVYAGQERPTKSIPNWKAVKSFAYPIKVWSPVSMKRAQAALNIIEDKAMYYNFSKLLGKEPLSDEKEKDDQGRSDNGGDGNLDIYLVPPAKVDYDNGECVSIHGGKTTPAWILINQNLSGDDLVATLAHEIFHAFQFAFDQHEDDWWLEGTAVWAEDYIDRAMDTEQEYLEGVFFGPAHRLVTLTEEDGYHEYSIYLFPYYLSCKFGNDKIAEIWKSCENDDALDAVDNAVSEGMDECFKNFALLNFDLGPYEGSYVDARGPLELYDYHGASYCFLHLEGEESLNFPLQPLSATYVLVENLCDPAQTPYIRFGLEDFARNNKLTVQAIIDPEGKAEEEDWSSLSERTFCINREEEYFEKIALVIGSSEKESTVFPDLTIEIKKEGCAPLGGFGQFQITTSHETKWPEIGRGAGSYYKYTLTATGHITFEPYDYAGQFEGRAFVQISEKIERKETVGPDGMLLKEEHIVREGSDNVSCTLSYAWGEEDAGYTFEIDDVKTKGRDKIINYYTNWPGPPVVETNEYDTNTSVPSSYFNSYYVGKPQRYSLSLSGSYSESSWQELSASWLFKLNEPPKRNP